MMVWNVLQESENITRVTSNRVTNKNIYVYDKQMKRKNKNVRLKSRVCSYNKACVRMT